MIELIHHCRWILHLKLLRLHKRLLSKLHIAKIILHWFLDDLLGRLLCKGLYLRIAHNLLLVLYMWVIHCWGTINSIVRLTDLVSSWEFWFDSFCWHTCLEILSLKREKEIFCLFIEQFFVWIRNKRTNFTFVASQNRIHLQIVTGNCFEKQFLACIQKMLVWTVIWLNLIFSGSS